MEGEDKMEIKAISEDESDKEDTQSVAMESVTMSELPIGDERYDKEINLTEEQETLKKIKGCGLTFQIFYLFLNFYL